MLTSLELEDYAQNFAVRNVLKLEDVTRFPSVYELRDDLVIPLVPAYKIIERTNMLLEAKAHSSQPCEVGSSLPTQGSISMRSPASAGGLFGQPLAAAPAVAAGGFGQQQPAGGATGGIFGQPAAPAAVPAAGLG